MKVGDLVKIRESSRVRFVHVKGYGVIVERRDDGNLGSTAKVVWQGLACHSSWELLRDLIGAAHELMAFKGDK